MGIVVIGATFVDIKGFPEDTYLPTGRNVGRVEYIHGGVARNVVEDIANVELRPTFLGIVDDTPMGADVLQKLNNHKVNTDYVMTIPGGMGTWLAVFDNNGDVAGSISKRPDLMPLLELLEANQDLQGYSVADKVVGKAAAMLYACMHVRQVYAPVMSAGAEYTLLRHGIAALYDKKTERIQNRRGDGLCPMESAVWDIDDPEQAYKILKNATK